MSHLSFIKDLPGKVSQPPVIAALASVGLHGVLAYTLPSLSASSNPEEQKPRGTVKVVQLTPAEQSRIPQLAPPPVALPLPNPTGMFPPLPPPSSDALPPIPNIPNNYPSLADALPPPSVTIPSDILRIPGAPPQIRTRGDSFKISAAPSALPRYTPPDPRKFDWRDRIRQSGRLPSGVQSEQFDISKLPPPPFVEPQPSTNPEPQFSPNPEPQFSPNPEPQFSPNPEQRSATTEPQFSANPQPPSSATTEPRPSATPEQRTSPQELAQARVSQLLADQRLRRQDFKEDEISSSDNDGKIKGARWLTERGKRDWQEMTIVASYPKDACFMQREGTAKVAALADANGNPIGQPDLLQSSGDRILNKKAQEVVKNYKFKPTGEEQAYMVGVQFDYNKEDCPQVSSAPRDRTSTRTPESSKPQASPKPEASTKPETSPKPETEAKPEELSRPNESRKPEASPKPETSTKPEESPKPETSTKPEASTKPETSTKPEAEAKPEASTKPEASPKPETSTKPEAEAKPEESPKPEASPKPEESFKPEESPTPTEN
ncbi:TonB family protein [Trichocoleus sp. FACHB-90]|uniref:TonB family protein n=1 Tax=Cyanophyceae TaxID=3028117 RepID=UPI001688D173|nr:TonB family protein [Trichocoleus sp. FACHB-90]MBD1929113.1 TonB family protein [Trichocoleus sp. FACHB-90]